MKLEMTLDERPGFLHVVPLFDLFALVVMLILLEPRFVARGGVSVEVPESQFQMQRYEESIVVTLGPGDAGARLHLGRRPVSLEELREELVKMRTEEVLARTIVLLQADVGASVGMERKVSEVILSTGFKLGSVGMAAEAGELGGKKSSDE